MNTTEENPARTPSSRPPTCFVHTPTALPEGKARRVQAFFADYADRFNRSLSGEMVDAKEVAESFAPHFVGASPAGVHGAKNGLLFRWMIPRGFAHYRKIGTTQMRITDVAVDAFDPSHALAKVHWDARYRKKDGESDRIEFDVTYLLHFENEEPKIFAYVTGDEQKILTEHGLLD